MQVIEHKEHRIKTMHFESWGHLANYANNLNHGHSCGDKWAFGTDEEYNSRQKVKSAMELGRSKPSTLKKVSEKRDSILNSESVKSAIRNNVLTTRKKRVYRETGSELDIDRVLCGDPNHWQSTTNFSKNKFVRIGISYTLSCGNGSEEFENIAAIGCVACEALTLAGYSVEIVALGVASAIGEYSEGGCVTVIKQANQPLDINSICVSGIVGMYRGFTFDVWDKHLNPDTDKGMAKPTTNKFKELYKIDHVIEKKWTDKSKQEQLIDGLFK